MNPKPGPLYDKAFEKLLAYRAALSGGTFEDAGVELRNMVVSVIIADKEFVSKINGMMLRNNLALSTKIQEDVLQEIAFQLCKCSPSMLIDMHCDSYRRVFGLAVTIATRAGFGKMKKEVHQNSSVAKQITFKSNLNQKAHLSSTEDEIVIDDTKHKLPVVGEEEDLWQYIRSMLTEEEQGFLDFILEKVLNRKYRESYPVKLRRDYYSLTEYKILRLALHAKIKKIISERP